MTKEKNLFIWNEVCQFGGNDVILTGTIENDQIFDSKNNQ